MSMGREAGFSATAAKNAAFGRNDDFCRWIEKNRQLQKQLQVPSTSSGQALRLTHSRFAQDDTFLEWVNS
jgi:hypothetical protein